MITDQSNRDKDRLIRAFLAIPLDSATLKTVLTIQKRLEPHLPDVRWIDQNSLHLTLNFFGDITEESLEKVAKIMVSVGSLFMPFTLTLTETGAFPSVDRARVVWLGVKSDKLEELYRALHAELIRAGLPVEHRPFRPHITIGRSRRQAGHILSQREFNVTGSMRVTKLTLYESRLQPTGAEHRPRKTVRLAEP